MKNEKHEGRHWWRKALFFAGVSGAAVADTAAIGSILIPAMKDQGYE